MIRAFYARHDTRRTGRVLCGGTGAWSKPYRNAGYEVQNSIPTGFAHKLPFRFFDPLLTFQFIFICQKIQ